MKEKIAIYCRVSTEAQDNNFSIKEQESRGIEFAKSHNFAYKVFNDTFTGTTIERPEFQRYLKQKDQFIGLWVIEFTRLSRNVGDSDFLYNYFIKNTIKVWINTELLQLGTPEQFLSYMMNSVISAYEHKRIKERMERGIQKKKEDGGLWHSNIPYGYESYFNEQGKRLIRINETEAQKVNYIFTEVADKKRAFKNLCNEFNERGISPRKGVKWWDSNFSRIVKQPLYAGFYIYKDKEVSSLNYPVIVDREIWNKAQEETKRKNLKYSIRYNYNESSSLIRCYYCNEKMIFHNKKTPIIKDGKVINYKYNAQYKINHKKSCKRKIQQSNFRPKELLDYLVGNYFILLTLDRKSLIDYYEKEKEKYSEKEDQLTCDIKRLSEERKEIKTKKNNLIQMQMIAPNDPDVINQFKILSNQEKSLSEKIHTLENELKNDSSRIENILAKISFHLNNEFNGSDSFAKRKLVLSFLKDAYIKDNSLHWVWITGLTHDIPNLREWKEIAIKKLEERTEKNNKEKTDFGINFNFKKRSKKEKERLDFLEKKLDDYLKKIVELEKKEDGKEELEAIMQPYDSYLKEYKKIIDN